MASEAQLRSMDLTKKGENDDILGYSEWARKRTIHTAVKKSYQIDKPRGDVDIPEEAFIVKEEVAVWIRKHLTWSHGESRASKHLKVASNPDTYSVRDYAQFIPTQVLDTRTYFDAFYNKHKGNVDTLEKSMIDVAFSVFKCNLELVEQDHITEHSREVHGIEGGITSLSPLQEIEVDSSITFTCPSLLQIKESGPDRRKQIVTSVFYRCTSRGVITNSQTNRGFSDLKPSRSKEFMLELEKSCQKTYFARFKLSLIHI